MKTLLFIILIISILTTAALAQTSDWRSVEQLPAGTKIKVQLKHGRTFGHCFFNGASANQLTCTIPGPIYLGSRQFVYQRDNVKAVFRAHNGALIGFGVGATTGAILGASKDPIPGMGRGGTALLVGGIMGGLGGFVGMIADPFFHGKAVYRATNHPQNQRTVATPEPPQKVPENAIPCLRDGTTLECIDQSSVESLRKLENGQ